MRSPNRILLVEDDSSLRETLADVLSDEGFEVAAAANGREALEKLAASHPDLILLDLVMPVMDGWAFREAQRKRPDLACIPTVVLSATSPLDGPGLHALDAEAVISKPVRMERLIGALRALLAAPPSNLKH
jgi:CheY-like chemotaxis protein